MEEAKRRLANMLMERARQPHFAGHDAPHLAGRCRHQGPARHGPRAASRANRLPGAVPFHPAHPGTLGGDVKIFRNRREALMVLTGPAHLRLAAETIGDQYQVGEMLFADEAGVVYHGQDRRAGAPVLVRVVAGQDNDPERSAVAVKAQAWQRVHHPGVLTARALIASDTWLAHIWAKPEGQSLRDWRARAPEWKALWLPPDSYVRR